MRPAGRGFPAWLSAVCSLIICEHVCADVVFKLPEVLVRHSAAPKSVGTSGGPKNATRQPAVTKKTPEPAYRVKDSDDGKDYLELSFDEFYVEHEISTVDARAAAKKLNLDEVPQSRPGCGPCTTKDMDYCEWRVVADHCCCEQRFFPEPLPWLPHTCYVGPDRCKPRVHDCALYARMRDCCCYRKLAEKWKNILSGSSSKNRSFFSSLFSALVVLFILV